MELLQCEEFPGSLIKWTCLCGYSDYVRILCTGIGVYKEQFEKSRSTRLQQNKTKRVETYALRWPSTLSSLTCLVHVAKEPALWSSIHKGCLFTAWTSDDSCSKWSKRFWEFSLSASHQHKGVYMTEDEVIAFHWFPPFWCGVGPGTSWFFFFYVCDNGELAE